jgi:16S rRNA (cytosine967-C5)-methyltransferase
MPTQEPVKIFTPIKNGLVSSLTYLFENRSSASKVIQYTFKQNKKWGSRDRKVFAEAFYTIVRHAGWYFAAIGKKDFSALTLEETYKIVTLYEEGAALEAPLDFHLKHSISKDLEEVLRSEQSEDQMLDFLKKSNEEAPVFLRVNTLKTNDKGCAEHLLKEGIKSSKVKENCLMLEERKNIFTSDTFKNGFFEIQDGASQDVAPFMELEKGMRVADSCSGAGGKALHMASKLENSGTLVAMDIFPRRLEELKKRAKRAGVSNLQIKPIEGTKTIKRMENKFDRTLLDVPCTGAGTYRRKPEAKLFFSKEEHARLMQTQQEILELHSKLVKPGGKLIYATCSVFPTENRKQVDLFLKRHEEFKFETDESKSVGQDSFDGFYMARMVKN